MKINSVAPAFLVDDVAATARWYVETLGFTLVAHFPKEEPYAYGGIQLGPAEIMLLSMPGYKRPDRSDLRPVGFWDAYVRMTGVREFYEQFAGKNFIRMPLKKQAYGDWEFEVRDPNGYIIVFGGDPELE